LVYEISHSTNEIKKQSLILELVDENDDFITVLETNNTTFDLIIEFKK